MRIKSHVYVHGISIYPILGKGVIEAIEREYSRIFWSVVLNPHDCLPLLFIHNGTSFAEVLPKLRIPLEEECHQYDGYHNDQY